MKSTKLKNEEHEKNSPNKPDQIQLPHTGREDASNLPQFRLLPGHKKHPAFCLLTVLQTDKGGIPDIERFLNLPYLA